MNEPLESRPSHTNRCACSSPPNGQSQIEQDHLEEIFTKWSLLDDEIWCKLIIMERNRRIGKAYARVPRVTIDGSQELSYDGFRLALNGFQSIERDPQTEECRRRIGKGIRIKMDNYGNILIKRLSKAAVFVKEWQPAGYACADSGLSPANSLGDSPAGSSSSGSNNQQAASKQIVSRAALTGKQENDCAICDEVTSVGGRLDLDKIYVMFDMKKFQLNISQELNRRAPDKRKLEQQCCSIIGLVRDSEEILSLPCWLMVINIIAIEVLNERFPLNASNLSPFNSHHLGPLHQQHLSRAQMLKQHQPPAPNQQQAPNFVSIFDQQPPSAKGGLQQRGPRKEEDPYSLPANASSSDLKSSIGTDGYGTSSTKYQHIGGRYSDTYLPSGASSSAALQARGGGYQATSEMGHPNKGYSQAMASSKARVGAASQSQLMSNNHDAQNPLMSRLQQPHHNNNSRAYHNNTSIYSPGHMLVPPPGDTGKPPKLPPRDFSKMTNGVSQPTSKHLHQRVDKDNQAKATKQLVKKKPAREEEIYSVGLINHTNDQPSAGQPTTTTGSCNQDEQKSGKSKSKKSKSFLESLKGPLAKSSSSSASPASAGAKSNSNPNPNQKPDSTPKAEVSNQNQKLVAPKKSSKNSLKSFLGVKSSSSSNSNSNNNSNLQSSEISKNGGLSSKQQQMINNKNNPVPQVNSTTKPLDQGAEVEVDSVVDSNEEQSPAATSRSSSFNDDLDIPTPDYETDENIYAIGSQQHSQQQYSSSSQRLNYKKNHYNRHQTAEDLYYSGYSAHTGQQLGGYSGCSEHALYEASGPDHQQYNSVEMLKASDPSHRMMHNHHHHQQQHQQQQMICRSQSQQKLAMPRENSRFMLHKKMLACSRSGPGAELGARSVCGAGKPAMSRLGDRSSIYGSTLGIAASCVGGAGPARSVMGVPSSGLNPSRGSHYRSASMQRCYSQQRFPTTTHQQGSNNNYGFSSTSTKYPSSSMHYAAYGPAADCPLEDIYGPIGHHRHQQSHYAAGGYGQTTANYAASMLGVSSAQQQQMHHYKLRRRSVSRSGANYNSSYGTGFVQSGARYPALVGGGPVAAMPSCCSQSNANAINYDIGRSSSGIYGNNGSSSSSSDSYADWQPPNNHHHNRQPPLIHTPIRKVNSSGYLNSIFKNTHNLIVAPNNKNNNNNNNINNKGSQESKSPLSTTTNQHQNNNNNNNNIDINTHHNHPAHSKSVVATPFTQSESNGTTRNSLQKGATIITGDSRSNNSNNNSNNDNSSDPLDNKNKSNSNLAIAKHNTTYNNNNNNITSNNRLVQSSSSPSPRTLQASNNTNLKSQSHNQTTDPNSNSSVADDTDSNQRQSLNAKKLVSTLTTTTTTTARQPQQTIKSNR